MQLKNERKRSNEEMKMLKQRLQLCASPLYLPSSLFALQILSYQSATHLSSTRHSTHLLRMAESSVNDSLSSYHHQDYAEIVVVRHGQTAWNAEGRTQGHLDVELNEAGRQQAADVADRLSKEPKISAIYSSDLKRASETAQIIASKCGGLEVVKDFDLRERHKGGLQGLVSREAAKTNPKGYNVLMSQNEDQEIPGGGESLVQLLERCKSVLLRIGRKHKGERVVVVTHGAFIEALYKWACAKGKYERNIYNASISIFKLYGEDKWTLKMWADVSHLSQN